MNTPNENYDTGFASISSQKENNNISTEEKPRKVWSWKIILLVIFIFGASYINDYFSSDNSSNYIEQNDKAITLINEGGNEEEAISLLEDAIENMEDGENKMITLINLAYQYDSEKALPLFKKALALTDKNSADYYFISGEIATLEYNPKIALYNFQKAVDLRPTDFQTNNSLGLFYLGFYEYIDEADEQYIDYDLALKYLLIAKENKDSAGFNDETINDNLGIAYLFIEEYQISLDYFLNLNQSESPIVQYWIAYDYLGLGNVEKAKEAFSNAKAGGMVEQAEINQALGNLK